MGTMTPHNPDWDVCRASGEEAEALFSVLRKGVMLGTTEVKNDREARRTGNVFVEYKCRHADGNWHSSGLSRTRAANWCFVMDFSALIVPTWAMRSMCRIALEQPEPVGRTVEMSRGTHPTKGVLIPVTALLPLYFEALRRAEDAPAEVAA